MGSSIDNNKSLTEQLTGFEDMHEFTFTNLDEFKYPLATTSEQIMLIQAGYWNPLVTPPLSQQSFRWQGVSPVTDQRNYQFNNSSSSTADSDQYHQSKPYKPLLKVLKLVEAYHVKFQGNVEKSLSALKLKQHLETFIKNFSDAQILVFSGRTAESFYKNFQVAESEKKLLKRILNSTKNGFKKAS